MLNFMDLFHRLSFEVAFMLWLCCILMQFQAYICTSFTLDINHCSLQQFQFATGSELLLVAMHADFVCTVTHCKMLQLILTAECSLVPQITVKNSHCAMAALVMQLS